MKRKFFQKYCRHLIRGAMIVILSFPSFSQGEIQKPGPLTINKIEVMKVAEGTRVFIEGTGPLEYSAFQRTKPSRVVLDLPQAILGKLAGSIPVQDEIIKSIHNKQITDSPHPYARVEIILERPVEYAVDSVENSIIIDLEEHKPALIAAAIEDKKTEEKEEKRIEETKEVLVQKQAPLKGKLLTEIQVAAQANFLEVGIKGTEPSVDFRSFRLVNPPRLVLDFPGFKNATGKRKVEVGSPWLREIRLGEYPEKLRLVFTFPDKKIPPYTLQKEEQELRVILGAKQEPTPPVASPPQPVKVDEKEKIAEKEFKKEAADQEIKKQEIERPAVASPPAEKILAQAQMPAQAPLYETKPQGELEKVQVSPYKGARISLDFKDADLHNIFRLLAEVSNLNIITTDEVKGKITIRLVNVPWDQALDVILTTKNLVKIEEGNVLRITTAESVRKEREEKQKEEDLLVKVKESREKLEPLTTETITVNYAKAADLQKLIREKDEKGKGFLSPRGSVKADERTNTLIIQDTKQNIEEIINLIKKLDSPTPQVLIEARVVQAQTTFARSLGIQWGGSYNQTGGGQWHWGLTGNNPSASAGWGFTPSATGTSTPLIMPSNFVVNFPASTGNTQIGGLGISFGKLTGNLVNLDLRLQLGETEGQTKVIARPKLATLTNTPAHIKQGELIPYETTSQAGTQVQFIDAVLMLEVTPQVTPDGSIKMTVKVTRDSRGTFRSPSMQVPSIDKREAKTEVLVKDGETLVIGGIYESENQESETRIPWLGKIPILGWLFKSKEIYNSKKELLIFITPTLLQGMKAES
ncbi:MAG: type IV pilus secretin PilQ [Thermodesulfobacteriota bacterium]